MSWSLSGVGYLEFNFENINLPDSSNDEAGSHGFIQFSIRTKAGLPVGSIITNEAFIYFDYNPEVATNVTTNKIENVTFITTPPSSQVAVFVYPNPVGNILNVRTTLLGSMDVTIKDVLGREVFRQSNLLNPSRIHTEEWMDGIYFINVEQNRVVSGTRKFIKY
jgi:hypothetical protein